MFWLGKKNGSRVQPEDCGPHCSRSFLSTGTGDRRLVVTESATGLRILLQSKNPRTVSLTPIGTNGLMPNPAV